MRFSSYEQQKAAFANMKSSGISVVDDKIINDIVDTQIEEKVLLYDSYKKMLRQYPESYRRIKYWKNKVDSGITSKTTNSINGLYSNDRLKIHEKIINDILNKNVGKERPTVVFLGGATASGKTGLLRYIVNKDNYVYLNNDDIKKALPEYDNYSSMFLHDESKDIQNNVVRKVLSNKRNLIFDSTLSNTLKNKDAFNDFRNAGYRVVMLSNIIPMKEALSRSVSRMLNVGEEGRYVPLKKIIDNTDNINRVQMESLKYADEGSIFYSGVKKGESYKLIAVKGEI